MVHFDVQLIGGMAIHNGMIAEMATGERALVATLPVYLNALRKRRPRWQLHLIITLSVILNGWDISISG